MKLIQRISAGLSLLAIALAPCNALANYTTPHKVTVDGKTYVFIPGQTAGSPVTGFSAPKAPTTRVLTLNNCGWGSFTKSATSPPTMITGANWSGKTTGSPVTCTKNAAPATTYTSSNPLAAVGAIIDDGTKLWVKGGTGPGSVTLQITTSGTITTKANACGFVRVTTSTSRPMTEFKVGATSYTLASLPSKTSPMICRKVGTSSFTYVPAN